MATSSTNTAQAANLGFEAKLFLTADKLRGSMDASEYKHVALGLVFLKYISDAFTTVFEKLQAEEYADEEVAFYEALSENDSAVDVMGDTKLKLIANELLQSVRSNATIDWHHSEMARAKIRVAVKRILKKYGYPPDLQSAAIQTVLQQAEAFSEKWAA